MSGIKIYLKKTTKKTVPIELRRCLAWRLWEKEEFESEVDISASNESEYYIFAGTFLHVLLKACGYNCCSLLLDLLSREVVRKKW